MGFPGKQILPNSTPLNRLITAGYIPVAADDLTTVAFVQSLFSGLYPKGECRLGAVGNVNIATPPTTYDSIAAVDGDRIVLQQQTNPVENGVYNYHSSGLVRSSDFDGAPASEVKIGSLVFVSEGATFGGFGFFVSGTAAAPPNINVGTDPIIFSVLERRTQYTSDNGLIIIGNNIRWGGNLGVDTLIDGGGLYLLNLANLLSLEISGPNSRLVLDKGGSRFRLENLAATKIYLDIIGDQVFLKNLSLLDIPAVDNALTKILLIDESDGSVKIKDASDVVGDTSTYIKNMGDYDASSNLYPDVGTATGSGPSGAIRKNDEFILNPGGTLDGVDIPPDVILRARVHNPGQVTANWRFFY